MLIFLSQKIAHLKIIMIQLYNDINYGNYD